MLKKRVTNIKKILDLFIKELEKEIRIEKVVLFGSYARKSPRDYSDIDILVVSPDFEGGTAKDYLLLDKIARRVNPLIEAIPYTPSDFKNFERGDFVDAVRTSGKVIFDKVA